MSQADVMRRANTFIDGKDYIGKATYQSPEIAFKTEADEKSFLSVNQILGAEAMNSEITINQYSPAALKLLNICNGSTVPFVFRGSYEDDGCNKVSYQEEIEGKISKLVPGEKKLGKAETKFTVEVYKYKLIVAGEVIYHLSQDVFIVDGVDQMAEHVNNAGG